MGEGHWTPFHPIGTRETGRTSSGADRGRWIVAERSMHQPRPKCRLWKPQTSALPLPPPLRSGGFGRKRSDKEKNPEPMTREQ